MPNRRAIVLGALLAVGALLTAAGVRGAQAPPAIVVDKIAEELYVLRGGGGNTAVFITAGGVVLVDTKVPGWGAPILEAVKTITGRPVTTVINTHTHFDHVGGNPELPAGIEVVAHATTAELMREMRPVTGGPQQPRVFKEGSRGLPTRTFTDRLTLGSGPDRVELRWFGRAHTGGDAWVIFPALRAAHAGDVFANKTLPVVDASNGGSAVGYPEALARAAALPGIDVVITGHMAATQTLADLKMYEAFNRDFVEAARAAKGAGRSAAEFAKVWRVPKQYLQAGYLTAEQYEQQARQPMAARVLANAEVVWQELP